jgi:hypothetical protein
MAISFKRDHHYIHNTAPITMPPEGFKRSRALWDDARRKQSSTSEQARSWLRVLLYEIQPIRFSEIDTDKIVLFLRSIYEALLYGTKSFPGWCRAVYSFLRARTRQQWTIVGAVVAYYYVVRFIHE